jgi:hypothetical protein
VVEHKRDDRRILVSGHTEAQLLELVPEEVAVLSQRLDSAMVCGVRAKRVRK